MAFSNPQSLKPEEKEKVVEKGRTPNSSIQHPWLTNTVIYEQESKTETLLPFCPQMCHY